MSCYVSHILEKNKNYGIILIVAIVAQLVEQLIRNEQVAGSIPVNGSIFYGLIQALYSKIY